MKAEAYSHLYSFSAAFEQAWEAIQKLQPHLALTRSSLKEIYFRLQEARFTTLVTLGEYRSGYERAAASRIRKQKASWEAQEEERERREKALMRGEKVMRQAAAEQVKKHASAKLGKTRQRK